MSRNLQKFFALGAVAALAGTTSMHISGAEASKDFEDPSVSVVQETFTGLLFIDRDHDGLFTDGKDLKVAPDRLDFFTQDGQESLDYEYDQDSLLHIDVTGNTAALNHLRVEVTEPPEDFISISNNVYENGQTHLSMPIVTEDTLACKTGKFSTTVFFDVNGDSIFDSGDIPIKNSNILINAVPAVTDANGFVEVDIEYPLGLVHEVEVDVDLTGTEYDTPYYSELGFSPIMVAVTDVLCEGVDNNTDHLDVSDAGEIVSHSLRLTDSDGNLLDVSGVEFEIKDANGDPVTDIDGNPRVANSDNGVVTFGMLPETSDNYFISITAAGKTTLKDLGYLINGNIGGAVGNNDYVSPVALTKYEGITVKGSILMDKNSNGSHDFGEYAQDGVKVTLSVEDSQGNKVALPSGVKAEYVTGEFGDFTITGLPKLPAGQKYFVTVDESTLYTLYSVDGEAKREIDTSAIGEFENGQVSILINLVQNEIDTIWDNKPPIEQADDDEEEFIDDEENDNVINNDDEDETTTIIENDNSLNDDDSSVDALADTGADGVYLQGLLSVLLVALGALFAFKAKVLKV